MWWGAGYPVEIRLAPNRKRSEEHSDAQITMNVYNHIAEKSHVENEMSKMNLQNQYPLWYKP